jgi:hypothetical protein
MKRKAGFVAVVSLLAAAIVVSSASADQPLVFPYDTTATTVSNNLSPQLTRDAGFPSLASKLHARIMSVSQSTSISSSRGERPESRSSSPAFWFEPMQPKCKAALVVRF